MLGANLLGLLAIGSEDVGGGKGRSGYGTLWERASPSRRAPHGLHAPLHVRRPPPALMQPRRAWRRQKRGGAAQGGRAAGRMALPSSHCCPCPRRLRRKPWRSWRKVPSIAAQRPRRVQRGCVWKVHSSSSGYLCRPEPAPCPHVPPRSLSLLPLWWRPGSRP